MFCNLGKVYIICTILLSTSWPLTRANTKVKMFLAITKYELLAQEHKHNLDHLEKYIFKEEERLSVIKRIIKYGYKKEYDVASKDVTTYIRIPMNAFTIVKGLTTDLDEIKKQIKLGIENNNKLKSELKKTTNLPKKEDFEELAIAVRRLQDTYKMDVKELAEGKINGANYSLSADDCYALSRVFCGMKDYDAAEAWILEAIQKREPDDVFSYNQGVDLWISYLDYIQRAAAMRKYQKDPKIDVNEVFTPKQ